MRSDCFIINAGVQQNKPTKWHQVKYQINLASVQSDQSLRVALFVKPENQRFYANKKESILDACDILLVLSCFCLFFYFHTQWKILQPNSVSYMET